MGDDMELGILWMIFRLKGHFSKRLFCFGFMVATVL